MNKLKQYKKLVYFVCVCGGGGGGGLFYSLNFLFVWDPRHFRSLNHDITHC